MRNLSSKSHRKKKKKSNKRAPKEEFHKRELKLNLMRNRLLKMAIRRSKLNNLNELRMKMKTGPKLATRASPGKI